MNSKRILSYIRRAVDDYGMIEDGDRIAVGVSGGKDSLTLLCAMAQLRLFYPKRFSLHAITIDMGFDSADFSGIRELAQSLDVPYTVVPTRIGRIIFGERKEHNPCSLCSKMRNGALHKAAAQLGCNKVALGHHKDDVIETFFLNLFYGGSLAVFSPVTALDRSGLLCIRPMIYLPEKDIRYFSSKEKLPAAVNPCPANRHTERETMKSYIRELSKTNRDIKNKVFGAIQRAGISGYKNNPRAE